MSGATGAGGASALEHEPGGLVDATLGRLDLDQLARLARVFSPTAHGFSVLWATADDADRLE
jgi:hypothetical protein